MKKLTYLITVLTVTVLLSVSSYAGENPKAKSNLSIDNIEQNLILGINSANTGLRTSSAYFLGELKSENAVIPLMALLHNEEDDGSRLMAALSLYKIGTDKAIYAVKQAAKFDSSERVRRLCKLFYSVFQSDRNSKHNLEVVAAK